jgi:hypothetical protein
MKSKINLATTLIALQILLSSFVLGAVAYSVINSDFDGFIQMKLGRDGGEVILDRRTPPALADK